MSREQVRAVAGALAPSALLLATAVLGLAVRHLLAIRFRDFDQRGRHRRRAAMLVGYARCITIATGAMMAIGAYGATIPVVHGKVPFSGGPCVFHVVGRSRGLHPGDPRGPVSQPQSRDGHARLPGGRDHRAARKQGPDRRRGRHACAAAGHLRHFVRERREFPAAQRCVVRAWHCAHDRSARRVPSARTCERWPQTKMPRGHSASTCGIILSQPSPGARR